MNSEHQLSDMAGGKKRRGNKTLKSWVNFVKRVQHEEGISYKQAMSRAKARKREWQHGGGDTSSPLPSSTDGDMNVVSGSTIMGGTFLKPEGGGTARPKGGGRTRKSRKSRKSRKTRHRRR
jgi:hypothetical protein